MSVQKNATNIAEDAQIKITQISKLRFDVFGYTPGQKEVQIGAFRTLEKALLYLMKHSDKLPQVSFVALKGEIIDFHIN